MGCVWQDLTAGSGLSRRAPTPAISAGRRPGARSSASPHRRASRPPSAAVMYACCAVGSRCMAASEPHACTSHQEQLRQALPSTRLDALTRKCYKEHPARTLQL